MEISIIEKLRQLNIEVPSGATTEAKTFCPSCRNDRKPKNRNDRPLSVDLTNGLYHCHNCGFKGSVKNVKEYVKPKKHYSPISPEFTAFFQSRGISEGTLFLLKVGTINQFLPQVAKEVPCIQFNYFKNGIHINTKYRDANKNFMLVRDAELNVYNYDGIVNRKTIIITEGEIDCLSVYEAHYCDEMIGACSVPNGASKGSQKLEYLDNCWQAFSKAEKIILATDSDNPGISLKQELARRLGRERCFEITYKEGCKDLNEVLCRYGNGAVKECLNSAKALPVEGILRVDDFEDELDHLYENGDEKGVTVGYEYFDSHLRFLPGRFTIVTGIPNSGKSAFVDQLLIRLANRHKWNVGVCSFENQPVKRHAANLMSCYTGSRFYDYDQDPSLYPKMPKGDYKAGKEFLRKHFFWFAVNSFDTTVDGILDRARHLVRAHGIKMLLIDPYNCIENNKPDRLSETEYILTVLRKIESFAKEFQIHIILVAHPTKLYKDKNTGKYPPPTLYDISGSAHFYNKTDNGFSVYRDMETNLVTVYIQKVRFFNDGKKGQASFVFDPFTQRYRAENESDFIKEMYFDAPSKPIEIKYLHPQPEEPEVSFSTDDLPF